MNPQPVLQHFWSPLHLLSLEHVTAHEPRVSGMGQEPGLRTANNNNNTTTNNNNNNNNMKKKKSGSRSMIIMDGVDGECASDVMMMIKMTYNNADDDA